MKQATQKRFLTIFGLAALVPLTLWALNPGLPPGSNFDMEYWELQLPVDSNGGDTGSPATISSSQLQGGYQDSGHHFFFTESGDGAMVMKEPGVSCAKTPNSQHCRTELREVDPNTGSPTSWSPNAATNRMKATVAVTAVGPNSTDSVVIGQIYIDDSVSTRPVCELYYYANGDIKMGVEQTRAGDDEILTPVLANIPLGTQFSYEIEYSTNLLKVAINGNFQTLSTYSLDAPASYFKAGDYGQDAVASDVHFYALTIQH